MVTFCPRGPSRADPPNAYPVTKALLDGLVRAGLLSDDHSGIVVAQAFCRGPSTGVRGTHRVGVTAAAWEEGRS
ncbi:hypothetical protein D5R93_04420 [Actinomyces lilanjuaniae]|uniref:Uncharacterized protein n=1 Tax=Actinomyces lilanjuaniae TaxID=2321394 RepID=A0ABN5PP68_9ACTO|nr:hypothetical protein D5R93_04420 [Actinomyces lilanjuaniae]